MDELWATAAEASHPMHPLLAHLGKFIHDAFDHNESAKAKYWPNLEDVFTNIDLAANTGHHLGAISKSFEGQDLGPATTGKPRLATTTRRLASVGSKTPEADASRPDLLGLEVRRDQAEIVQTGAMVHGSRTASRFW